MCKKNFLIRIVIMAFIILGILGVNSIVKAAEPTLEFDKNKIVLSPDNNYIETIKETAKNLSDRQDLSHYIGDGQYDVSYEEKDDGWTYVRHESGGDYFIKYKYKMVDNSFTLSLINNTIYNNDLYISFRIKNNEETIKSYAIPIEIVVPQTQTIFIDKYDTWSSTQGNTVYQSAYLPDIASKFDCIGQAGSLDNYEIRMEYWNGSKWDGLSNNKVNNTGDNRTFIWGTGDGIIQVQAPNKNTNRIVFKICSEKYLKLGTNNSCPNFRVTYKYKDKTYQTFIIYKKNVKGIQITKNPELKGNTLDYSTMEVKVNYYLHGYNGSKDAEVAVKINAMSDSLKNACRATNNNGQYEIKMSYLGQIATTKVGTAQVPTPQATKTTEEDYVSKIEVKKKEGYLGVKSENGKAKLDSAGKATIDPKDFEYTLIMKSGSKKTYSYKQLEDLGVANKIKFSPEKLVAGKTTEVTVSYENGKNATPGKVNISVAAVQEKPAEQKPAEQKPAEQKPAEQKPAEQKPAEQKPAEQKPAEQKPAEQKATQEISLKKGKTYKYSGEEWNIRKAPKGQDGYEIQLGVIVNGDTIKVLEEGKSGEYIKIEIINAKDSKLSKGTIGYFYYGTSGESSNINKFSEITEKVEEETTNGNFISGILKIIIDLIMSIIKQLVGIK